MHRHSLDPVRLHEAAEFYGRMQGDGLMDEAECTRSLVEAIGRLPENVTVDRWGLQTRLCWVMADTREAKLRDRRYAARAVWVAVRPLVVERAPAGRILAVADDARGCLSVAQARAVAMEAVVAAMDGGGQ